MIINLAKERKSELIGAYGFHSLRIILQQVWPRSVLPTLKRPVVDWVNPN